MSPTPRSASTRGATEAERSTEFWRLLLADPDLLRSEFDAIVAAQWPDRPAVPPRRRIPGVPAPGEQPGAEPAGSGRPAPRRTRQVARPRQRSPPQASPQR